MCVNRAENEKRSHCFSGGMMKPNGVSSVKRTALNEYFQTDFCVYIIDFMLVSIHGLTNCCLSI